MASKLGSFSRPLICAQTLYRARLRAPVETAVNGAAQGTLKRFAGQYHRTGREGKISFKEFKKQGKYANWEEFKENPYVKRSCNNDPEKIEKSFRRYESLCHAEYEGYLHGGNPANMT